MLTPSCTTRHPDISKPTFQARSASEGGATPSLAGASGLYQAPRHLCRYVAGYSVAQAYHFTSTASIQVNVQPRSGPATARPAMSQCDPVSRSLNADGASLPAGSNVSARGPAPF